MPDSVSSTRASRDSTELANGQLWPVATRRPRIWWQLLVIVWLAWAYDAITNLPSLRERAALAHGLAILHLEERLHLDPERAMDYWLHGHSTLGLLAGDYYDNLHFIVTFAVLGWLWWRHPAEYRPLRTTLVLVNVIGFVVFWLYPVAPPRLLPGQHIWDIVAITHALGGWHSGTLAKAANQFASMPSLHLGWASWSALAVWVVFRHRRWSWLAWLYPVLTTVVVLATGNHFLLDCFAGVATTAVSAAVAYPAHHWWNRHWFRYTDARARRSASTGVVSTPSAGNDVQTTNAQP
jgi:predicted membrane protein